MRRALLIPLIASCDTEPCTTLGCDAEGVTLHLVHAGWTTGDGTAEVTVDGTAHSCTFTLPAGDVDEQYCGPAGVVLLNFDAETGGIASIWVDGDETEAVHVKLDLAGALLIDADAPFTWDKTFPNGPGCGPECLTADVDLTF
ncbi:MAG TPA: hypothetical protein PKA64_06845 [Myxococcota bacterium]|nr:hypothetical protein [Myxococcota bacterium]